MLMGLVHNGTYTVSNIGDSSAYLLKQNGQIMKLTEDHTPNKADEYKRIMKNNGFITMKGDVARIDGSLAVSRAIGDLQYQ